MAVRSLVDHARQHGGGRRYLIEHSAGSGKSNSIAWLAHRLAGLHNAQDTRVFDSIIVITDRRVLDRQLRRTVRSFSQVTGVVEAIEHGSSQLREALEAGKNVIITTLQKFPFVVEHVGTLPGRHFAVIIDEAHSSQSGESTKSLKQVLLAANLEEAQAEDAQPTAPDEEDDINAVVEAAMRGRGRLPHVSFFAFTATPKGKTLELFGTERADGSFVPFSLYSMRQAIEEGFILDVLKNYTTFRVYFSLLKNTPRDPSYNRKKALALLKSYADLHEHGIQTKTALMVEHFHEHVRHRISGQAKAMVVTRSRLHAVRYKQAFDRYLREQGYPYQVLVAFSGQVRDPDTGFTFTEAGMNGFPETQTADTFKQGQYRFLIVANKFQTGFDQPLLHTMYVDKKLGGVNAVQTLSRLNRTAPDKEDTLVLDFANSADEILQSFQPYYEATLLTEATDPNKLYDFQRILEDYHLFDRAAVEAFAAVYFSPGGTQARLHALLDPVVVAFRARDAEEQAGFRKHLLDYVRLYAFLSQVLTFADPDLEKLYQFARHLLRKLPITRDKLAVEVTANINMDSYRIQQTSSGQIALLQADGALQPITDLGTGVPTQGELASLSEILAYINEHYGTTFTTEDKLHHFTDDMERRMAANLGLVRALDKEINPSEDTRRLAFDHVFGDTLEDMIDANFDIYKKLVDDPTFGEIFRRAMFRRIVGRLATGGITG
jgi:type I restriction enzyme R subunit